MTWTYNGRCITELSDMPEGTFGFIYKITNGKTNQYYIGKKQVVSIRKRKFGKREIAALEDKRMKKYEMVQKESDWKTYFGSHPKIKELLTECKNKNEWQVWEKRILEICKTKKELTYYECKFLFINEVLENRSHQYINDNILGKFYRKDFTE